MPEAHTKTDSILRTVIRVLEHEAHSIQEAASRVGDEAVKVVELLEACQGRVILTGMGKAGSIARKAAATFCSTGAPALFLHPAEAVHGDLGIIAEGDLVIALSNSGETREIVELIPFLRRQRIPLVCLTGRVESTLASNSDVVVDTHVTNEADPLELAPTSSTTVMLAMTDALAIALMQRRGFTKEQFANFHPGGNLGRKLLLRVEDLMRGSECVPAVPQAMLLRNAIGVMTEKQLGCVFVIDDSRRLAGIFTDGDLRRYFGKLSGTNSIEPMNQTISCVMTPSARSIEAAALAAEALQLMEEFQITVLPVLDQNGRVTGVLHLHDLIRAGLA